MTEAMFAPIYHVGFQRGIAPAILDASPPHVVAWALVGTKNADEPETTDDLFAAHLERERLRALGREDEFYRASDVGI